MCVRVCAFMRVHVGGSTGVPAHSGQVFCEQNNLKMEGCLNIAVISGKLWRMNYVLRSGMPLVFKIDHMQDRVYVWDIINLTQRGRWRGANQNKITKQIVP